jgi:hypothetical protein
VSDFSFKWSGESALLSVLKKPVSRVSMIYDKAWGPLIVTLWHSDGRGIRISSEMFYVADRDEVGILAFRLVTEKFESEIEIEVLPFDILEVSKLTTVEANGEVAESGIVLQRDDGNPITIVASSGPCHLAIDGLVEWPLMFEPEYSIEVYSRSTLS